MAQTAEQKAKIQALLAKLHSKKAISPVALEQATADVAKADNIDLSNIIGNKTLDDEAAAEAVENVLEAAYGMSPSAAEQPGPPNIPQPEQEPKQEPEQPASPEQNIVLQRKVVGVARDDITLNAKQQEACDRIARGEDVVILGRAGTGKTTSMRSCIRALINSGRIPPIGIEQGTKYLQEGLPGVAIVSFTNKATNNIRHAMPDDVKAHTITIHKLLEFGPVYYLDEESGKNTMRFEPSRNRYNPLPSCLRAIGFEEGSMIGCDLHSMLDAALPHKCQRIYLGDIRQLPPVFDTAILGFKMLELPVIELTEVYRQALLSPILRCALTLDDGKVEEFQPGKAETYTTEDGRKRKRWPGLEKWNVATEHGTLHIQPWQEAVHPERAINNMALFFKMAWERGEYDPMEDIILCPHGAEYGGKSGNYLVSAANINKKIANFLGRARNAEVCEIIAGFNKHYFAVGDRVLYQKEDAIITKITHNGSYLGKSPEPKSVFLDRWGNMEGGKASPIGDILADLTEESIEDVDALLDSIGSGVEDRVNQSSHIIDLYIPSLDVTQTINTAKEVNDLLFAYALTVHKSQGSEYDRVFCVFHETHKTQLTRELVYTAFTRAKKYLHVFCPADALARACKNQAIKGNTLEEKALFFKGKFDSKAADKELFEMQQAKIDQCKLAVQTRIDVCIDKLKAAYPNQRFDLEVQTLYMDVGNCAAVAQSTNGTKAFIKISPTYLRADMDDMLFYTIPHELAHLYCHRWFGQTAHDHGPEWKELDAAMDGNGQQYHTLGQAAVLRTEQRNQGA
jgi:ATP-dependent exoDNAse (exonuclease V) alpha subunit/predicted SprT family Zn-dependent metalloprotease